jgi:hypothetical protein
MCHFQALIAAAGDRGDHKGALALDALLIDHRAAMKAEKAAYYKRR